MKLSRKFYASLLHFGAPKRITYGQKLEMTPNEFDIFIATLHDRMYRFARTLLGVQVEAEDAVADVEERLWRRHEALEQHRGAHSMAMTAVRNACLDRLRRQREELRERLPEMEAEFVAAVIEQAADLGEVYTFEQIRTLWEENFDRPFIEFYSSKKWDIIRKAGLLQV